MVKKQSTDDSQDNKQVKLQGEDNSESDLTYHEKTPLKVVLKDDDEWTTDSSPCSTTVSLNVDFLQCFLFALALFVRAYQLEKPRAIVFDEIFFGKFAGYYVTGTFFYDLNPPLGKLLYALVGYIYGNDGSFVYKSIGTEYDKTVPVWHMRMVSAVCGSLVVPLTYEVLKVMKIRWWVALGGAIMMLLDNALHTQSRFMMLEPIIQVFHLMTVISYVKFTQYKTRPFSGGWWFWLTVIGISWVGSTGTRSGGVFTGLLILGLLVKDFWYMLGDKTLTDRQCMYHFLARLFCVFCIPIALYVGIFYIHLTLLPKSGVYDHNMSSRFQASLEGGLAAITKGQPQFLAYGSIFTLRRTHGIPCWLHSHPFNYPKFYEPAKKRGSSQQQQVTCYRFKDPNNWWIIKHVDDDSLVVDEDAPKRVKHGDIIEIVHGKTTRFLNSHDVGAPVSPRHQEVTCYVDHNFTTGRVLPQTKWKVDIINRDVEGDEWKIITSQVRLIHVTTTQALKTTGNKLPDWGFYQDEVVTDTLHGQDTTVWNVEEHQYNKKKEDGERDRAISNAQLVPTEPTYMNFWEKFTELQIKMLFSRHDADLDHRYGTTPVQWPLCDKNVAYWASEDTKKQIHLLCNPALWCTGTITLLLYFGLLVLYMMRRHRQVYDVPEGLWNHFVQIGQILFAGYLANYLPYFMMDRTMFTFNYLPALVFKILLLAAFVDHLYSLICLFVPEKTLGKIFSNLMQLIFIGVFVAYLAWLLETFKKYAVLNQGTTTFTHDELRALQWRESWDFVFQL